MGPGRACGASRIGQHYLDRSAGVLIEQAIGLRRAIKWDAVSDEPGGLYYFSINFDGQTIPEPSLDADLDAHVETLYHRTMDERVVDGKLLSDSRAGRHLFGHLMRVGTSVIDAGSSDWVVFAGQDGYPADEAYFLHFIIHTIDNALRDHPDLGDRARFADWIAARHGQIDRGDLVYIAHQLDFMGRVPTSG